MRECRKGEPQLRPPTPRSLSSTAENSIENQTQDNIKWRQPEKVTFPHNEHAINKPRAIA